MSCTSNVCSLNEIVQEGEYDFLLDVHKAYDTVCHGL